MFTSYHDMNIKCIRSLSHTFMLHHGENHGMIKQPKDLKDVSNLILSVIVVVIAKHSCEFNFG